MIREEVPKSWGGCCSNKTAMKFSILITSSFHELFLCNILPIVEIFSKLESMDLGNAYKSMADSCQCMAKTTTIL